jgi:hypothetical protein
MQPGGLGLARMARSYLIFASLYTTCLRIVGSYFFVSSFSGWSFLFFVAV